MEKLDIPTIAYIMYTPIVLFYVPEMDFNVCKIFGFCTKGLILCSSFTKLVVEVKAFGSPHVLLLWLVVSLCMFPVKHILSNKSFVTVEFHEGHKTVTKFR